MLKKEKNKNANNSEGENNTANPELEERLAGECSCEYEHQSSDAGLLSGGMVACLLADTGSPQQAGSLRLAELAQLGSNEKPCLKV